MSAERESAKDSAAAPGSFPGTTPALGLYVLLAVFMTWPLAIHLGDRLPLGSNDLWQNYWNFWWWKTTLLEQWTSPYWTQLLYQPGDTSLAFHTHSPANVVSMLPVALLWNEAAALNIATLLGFILSGWGGYLLAREVCGHAGAAFAAGILLAFAPYHFEQSLEHLNLASYQGIPFFVLFFIRALRDGGKGNILLAAAFLALTALCSWHSGLLLVPFIVLVGVSALRRRDRRAVAVIRDAATVGGSAALLVLPFAWPLLQQMSAGEVFQKTPVAKGIDPAFLLLPAEHHPLWGGAVRGLYKGWQTYPSAGFTCYLGITTLALIAAGLLRARRAPPETSPVATDGGLSLGTSPRFWFGVLVVYLVLSLGKTLTIAGDRLFTPLPFAILEQTPLLSTLRVANRFSVGTTLAASVLLALALRSLGARPMLLSCCRVSRSGIMASAITLLIIDLLWLPYPLRELPQPGWVAALGETPPGLLLNVPGGHRARGAEDMYLQTLHGRPLVGGYTSVVPRRMEDRVAANPFLQRIFEGKPQVEVEAEAGLRRTLEELPVQVVVIHLGRRRERLEALREQHRGTPEARRFNPERGMPGAELDQVRAALKTLWGAPRHADEEVEIYSRPPGSQ
jgi:hypothetical protein